MSARVYIHPRCLSGPAFGALSASLAERGYDLNSVRIGPPSKKGYCELVHERGVSAEGMMILECFDGGRFLYKSQEPLTPEAA
jgi:hypothetical protein